MQQSVCPYLFHFLSALFGDFSCLCSVCCKGHVCFSICAQFESELNCSQCHTKSCWIIKSSRFVVHCTSLIHLLEEHSYMAKCTCCSCWQSVTDQILMVHAFVVTKNFGSHCVCLHDFSKLCSFSVCHDALWIIYSLSIFKWAERPSPWPALINNLFPETERKR